MVLLIVGLIIFCGVHLFIRLAPEFRTQLVDRMGEGPVKGIVSLDSLIGLVLICWGFSRVDYIHVWAPPSFLTHVNNLLMLLAIWLLIAAYAPRGVPFVMGRAKHPMLLATKVWAVAHLLVNGDLASIILFGTLLGWAVWQMILANRAGADTERSGAPLRSAVAHLVVSALAFGAIAGVHIWLGVNPFGG